MTRYQGPMDPADRFRTLVAAAPGSIGQAGTAMTESTATEKAVTVVGRRSKSPTENARPEEHALARVPTDAHPQHWHR
jgi:hypothetical protein